MNEYQPQRWHYHRLWCCRVITQLYTPWTRCKIVRVNEWARVLVQSQPSTICINATFQNRQLKHATDIVLNTDRSNSMRCHFQIDNRLFFLSYVLKTWSTKWSENARLSTALRLANVINHHQQQQHQHQKQFQQLIYTMAPSYKMSNRFSLTKSVW